MRPLGVRLALCHGAVAAGFGIFDVDAEAEGHGLLLRCFSSRKEFFLCCGRARVSNGPALSPPEGCFPDLDVAFDAARSGGPLPKTGGRRQRERGPFGIYRRRLARCCGEPLRLHRRMLFERAGATRNLLFPNWTVFKPDASAYVMGDPSMLELPGFLMENVGAASMSEGFLEIWDALGLASRGRDKQLRQNRELYAVGSAWGAKAVLWDGEDFLPIFEALRAAGVAMSYTILDIGAAAGLDAQSPLINLHHVYGDRIRGLAYEGDPELCREHNASLRTVQLRCGWLDLKSLRGGLPPARTWAVACSGPAARPRCVDVWKVDIDSIDCTAVEICLQRSDMSLWPKALVLEVNPHFPPPVRFSVLEVGLGGQAEDDMERLRHGLYGCSISHQVSSLGRYGYWLVGFAHKDAVFLHRDLAPLLGFSAPLDEFFAYAMSVVMTYDAVPPGVVREWFYARPHESLAMVDRHVTAARRLLRQHVAVSLSI